MLDSQIPLSRAKERLNLAVQRLASLSTLSEPISLSIREVGNLIQFSFPPDLDDCCFAILRTATFRAIYEHEALLLACHHTSFLRLVGSQFKFQSEGDPSWPICMIYAIISDSLHLILDEIFDVLGDRKLVGDLLFKEISPILEKEPTGMGEIPKFYFSQWNHRKTIALFNGILTEQELGALYLENLKMYVKQMEVQMEECGVTSPVGTLGLGWEAKATVICELIAPQIEKKKKRG